MAKNDKSKNVTIGSSAKNEIAESAAVTPAITGMVATTNTATVEPPITGMAVTTDVATAEPDSTGMAITANATATEPVAAGKAVVSSVEEVSKSICWQSGDWQESIGTVPPYNGLEVQAAPKYGSTGSLESVTVTIIDYTQIKEGAKTLHVFTLIQITNETESLISRPRTLNSTLNGCIKFRLLQRAPDYANLFLNLTYGLASPRHKNVQGCILQVPLAA